MNARDCSFLLLTSKLGDPERKPLSPYQLRIIADRFRFLPQNAADEEMSPQHLASLGIGEELSRRILHLLDDRLQLEAYLSAAMKRGCQPVTRTSKLYPAILRKRLGSDAPGCLWLKGDPEILKKRAVSLVGSRNLSNLNFAFAQEVGRQAAKQGFVLVSGNARGADISSQNACLHEGGEVICVIADTLSDHPQKEGILYLSEEEFDEPFSAQRALHRNRIIHGLGEITFVAQCSMGKGGTWSGSTHNLKNSLSPLYCFDDNSIASRELERLGATLISESMLSDFFSLSQNQLRFM